MFFMKDKKKTVLIIHIVSLLIAGCSQDIQLERKAENENIFYVENAEKIDESKVTYYYYDRLQGTEKELYCILYNNIMDEKQTFQLPEYTDYDVVLRIFTYVINDHPDIFWISGYELTLEKNIMTLVAIETLKNNSLEQLIKQCDQYRSVTDELVEKAKDEYEISKILYEYLIDNCTYGKTENDQNILSVVIDRESLCAGLSKAYQYLLQSYGIESVVITGITNENIPHMWNLVKIDGKYYYTDVTYGNTQSREEYNYEYFNVTSDQISSIYRFNAGQILVKCNSTDANYYQREGNLYTSMDIAKLKEQFSNGLPIQIKCADETIYLDMIQYLINERGIYNFIENETVNYETDDMSLLIKFN